MALKPAALVLLRLLSVTALLHLQRTQAATTWNVGGDAGWVLPPPAEYNDLIVPVGDILNFTYVATPDTPLNDVWKLKTPDEYQNCDFTNAVQLANQLKFLYTVTQEDYTLGTIYFASNTDFFHCQSGQKVTVVVVAGSGGGGDGAPPPPSSAPQKKPPPKGPPPKRPPPKKLPLPPAPLPSPAEPSPPPATSAPPPATSAPPPATSGAPAVFNIGGDVGWQLPPMAVYPNLTVKVGDTLNFTYDPNMDPSTFHDVWDMGNVDNYINCLFDTATILHNGSAPFLLTANKTGVFYYACSAFGYHCAVGQKVQVTVVAAAPTPPAAAPPPTTTPAPAPKTFNIGGDVGWQLPPMAVYPNLTVKVGDTLNFTYDPNMDPSTFHDVWDMGNIDNYVNCLFDTATILHNGSAPFLLTANKTGVFYYACSAFGYHCAVGQKVQVTVVAAAAPPPTPTPGPPPKTFNIGGDVGWQLPPLAVYDNLTVHVGDTLNFTYDPNMDPSTFHDVWDMKTEDAYTNCLFDNATILHNGSAPFLLTAKKKGVFYYACSAFGYHCAVGQKQKVTVKEVSTVPASGVVINVGGDEGWAPQVYLPLTAYVGDTLNFTGVTAVGRYAVSEMGTLGNMRSCTFTAPEVESLGFRANVTMEEEGTRFFASPAQGAAFCQLGLFRLAVNVLPESKRPPPPPPPAAPPPMMPSPVTPLPVGALPPSPSHSMSPPNTPLSPPPPDGDGDGGGDGGGGGGAESPEATLGGNGDEPLAMSPSSKTPTAPSSPLSPPPGGKWADSWRLQPWRLGGLLPSCLVLLSILHLV